MWFFVHERVWLIAGFLAGVVMGHPPARTLTVWLVVTAFLCWGTWVLARKRMTWFLLFLLAFGVGLAYMSWVEGTNHSTISEILQQKKSAEVHRLSERTEPVRPSYHVQVRGVLLSSPVVGGDRVRFVLLVRKMDWQGTSYLLREKVQVTLRLDEEREQQEVADWRPGSVLSMPLALRLPAAAANPGGFDYRQYLHQQRIHWLGDERGIDTVQVKPAVSLRGLVYDGQKRLQVVLDQLYDGDVAAFLKGLLLGERDAVTAEQNEDFSSLGIAHILAISGGHVAIVVALFLTLLQGLGVSRERSIGLTLMFLPAYALITGMQPPVIRAVIMAALALWALRQHRAYDSLDALFMAALLMAVWNPYLLFQISFQLSFLITFGIILWTDRLAQWMASLPGCWGWAPLRYSIAMTLVAQLVSFPLVITYFHEYSLLSTLANLIFVSLLSLIVLPLGYITLLIGLIHPGGAYLLAELNQKLSQLVLAGTSQMAQWRLFATTWPTPSLFWIVFYFLLCAWLMTILPQRRILPPVYERTTERQAAQRLPHWRQAPPLLVLFLLASWLVVAYLPHGTWERGVRVTILDVGQGDAAVVETPREVWLIDGGGRLTWDEEAWRQRRDPFDVGKDVVYPYLQHRGIRQIDGMVLTHGDADHVQGLKAVAERLPVRMVLVNGGPSTPVQAEVLEVLRNKGVPVYRAVSGLSWHAGDGIEWEVLHPPATERVENDNYHSVVLRLSAYGRQVLFTGDLDVEGERQLLSQGTIRPVDVLKVAHHGSDTSTTREWLAALQPKLAVISVGEGNRYGHPSAEVLQRLEEAGIPVLRTDWDGAVVLRFFSSGKWQVQTQHGYGMD